MPVPLPPPPILLSSTCTNTPTHRTYPQAQAHASTHNVNYPINHGIVENWDNMEKMWQRCIFKYLRCEPENHYMLLVR